MRCTAALTALLLAGTAACTSSGMTGPTDPDYDPMLDAADFGGPIDNPFFPLVPGTTFHYEGESEDGSETNDVVVTHDTRVILGITAVVVHDLVYLDGELIEETFDWYAQDLDGNVWYLGEDSREIEGGEIVGTAGSWEAGVNGAKPGIIMQADPQVGMRYYQEFALGEAEDEARVVAVNQTVTVPLGTFDGCLQTEDFTRLEPDAREHKFYCPGIGFVMEEALDGGSQAGLVEIEEP